MNNIPLHLLKAVLTAADSKNLSEAASLLQITQPGLTKQLQTLENLMPYKIFLTDGRKKNLTPFGQELVFQLRAKLQDIDSVVRQTCEQFSDPQNSTVIVAGRRGVLDRFSDRLQFPGKLIFSDMSNDESLNALINQKADLAINFLKPNSLDVISKPLFVEKFKLIVPKKMLRKPDHLKKAMDELMSYPCLTYGQTDSMFEVVLAYYQKNEKDLLIKRTTSNYHSIVTMVESGLGWSLVPRSFIVDVEKTWFIDVPSKIHITRQFYIHHRKELLKTSWLKLLRNEIIHCFKEYA